MALEISLVVFAIGVAFVVQQFMAHNRAPVIPESVTKVSDPVVPDVEGDERVPIEKSESAMPPLRIPKQFDDGLSDLGEEPDWESLDVYQGKILREDFERELTEVFTVGDEWREWIEIDEDQAVIRTDGEDEEKIYVLEFRKEGSATKVKRYWRKRGELPEATKGKPLTGLRVAIDPGHIGGNYAALEERRMEMGENAAPVQEGDMTLQVAIALKEQLESLGAIVNLVREKLEPVNQFRVDDYLGYVKDKLEEKRMLVTEESVMREAERLFYRVGEIRARARLVNYVFKPDVVLCLHFNAAGQVDEENPVLLEKEHFHMILNGAYTSGEVAHADERFLMILKILQGIHEEEAALAMKAADSFARRSGLPPYEYEPNSTRAVNVKGNPYLWARNLLANRLYECPVLFYEPYLMNGKDSYARMQVGDYDGLRYVNGVLRRSIFREYVDAVTEGLVDYYTD